MLVSDRSRSTTIIAMKRAQYTGVGAAVVWVQQWCGFCGLCTKAGTHYSSHKWRTKLLLYLMLFLFLTFNYLQSYSGHFLAL